MNFIHMLFFHRLIKKRANSSGLTLRFYIQKFKKQTVAARWLA